MNCVLKKTQTNDDFKKVVLARCAGPFSKRQGCAGLRRDAESAAAQGSVSKQGHIRVAEPPQRRAVHGAPRAG